MNRYFCIRAFRMCSCRWGEIGGFSVLMGISYVNVSVCCMHSSSNDGGNGDTLLFCYSMALLIDVMCLLLDGIPSKPNFLRNYAYVHIFSLKRTANRINSGATAESPTIWLLLSTANAKKCLTFRIGWFLDPCDSFYGLTKAHPTSTHTHGCHWIT